MGQEFCLEVSVQVGEKFQGPGMSEPSPGGHEGDLAGVGHY